MARRSISFRPPLTAVRLSLLSVVLLSVVVLGVSQHRALSAAAPASATQSAIQEWRTIRTEGATIKYFNIEPRYARAILSIARTSRSIYADIPGCDMPKSVLVTVQCDPRARTRLWTDGDHRIFLVVRSSAALAPPRLGGTHNIYGISHELGHIAMYRRITAVGQLPEGVAEGWAHYAGSVVTDEVYKRLGKSVWPVAHDYSEDGTKRLIRDMVDPNGMKDPAARAAAAFYTAQRRYGIKTVFWAMYQGTAGRPSGRYVMPAFVNALVKITGDESARSLFDGRAALPDVQWRVASRTIDDSTVEGLLTVPDDTGVLLKYDDGTSDGMLTAPGSGHVVVFRRPAGDWAADSVRVFGDRYGSPQTLDENFSIYICNQDFQVLKEIVQPYNKLDIGEPRWHGFSFEPVQVPEGFYVCVFFDPTATKGFYMHYDSGVKHTHSRNGLPGFFINDLKPDEKYDWMIRVHLKKM